MTQNNISKSFPGTLSLDTNNIYLFFGDIKFFIGKDRRYTIREELGSGGLKIQILKIIFSQLSPAAKIPECQYAG